MSLPGKFMNFSSQNGVIWCILGVLFLRFTCPVDCSSAKVKKVKHLSKYRGSSTQDDPCRSNIGEGGRDPRSPCGADASGGQVKKAASDRWH